MWVRGISSAFALAVICVWASQIDQAVGSKTPLAASAEYYDDEFEEDDNHPLPSQNDEVLSQQIGKNMRNETSSREDGVDGDPLMARPKEDPLQKLLPYITFDCVGRLEGYYADLQFGCEVFHYCKKEGKRFSFICPPNSTFNQRLMICDYDKMAKETCLEAPRYFHLNKQLYGIKKNYKFPELATSESQTVEKVVSIETTTPLSVERRSDTTPEKTEKPTEPPTTERPEKPTTPTPKRAKIRTKLARPSTVAPPAASSVEEKPNPVKKPPRKRKPRPSPSPRPAGSEPNADAPKPSFKKKHRSPRPRTTPGPQTIPRVQPAPPEHISHPAVTKPAVSDSEEVTLIATPAPQKTKNVPTNNEVPQGPKHSPIPQLGLHVPPSLNVLNTAPVFQDSPRPRPPIRSKAPPNRIKGPGSASPPIPSFLNTFPQPSNPDFPPIPKLDIKPDNIRVPHTVPVAPQPPRNHIRPSVQAEFHRQKLPKKNRKKSRPPLEPVRNEVPEYDRMFSAEQPRGAFPSQPVQGFANPNVPQAPVPQLDLAAQFRPQHHQNLPNQQVMPHHQHTPLQQPQHITQHQTQHIVHPPPQYEVPPTSQFQQPPPAQAGPAKGSVRFPAEQQQFPPLKPQALAGFDPGRHNGAPGTVDSHFYRGPEAVAHFSTGFGSPQSPPPQSKGSSQFPNYVQDAAQHNPRPTAAPRPQYEYVYQDGQQPGGFSVAGAFKPPFTTQPQSFKPQFDQTQSYKPPFEQAQTQFAQGDPSIFQGHQGYSRITPYDSGYGGLFGAASGPIAQGFFTGQTPSSGSFSAASLFPEQHIHHIHSRRRRSLDVDAAPSEAITTDESSIPRSRQRRQSMFSIIPNIFSRKPSRQSHPFASASSMNPTFAEVPGFYGGRFTQRLTPETQFPNFSNGFTRFFTGPPQSPFGGSGGNHLRVPPMSMGSPGLFPRGRGTPTINVGGPSTFTAVSLNQVPHASDLALNNNAFFSQATIHKQNAAKINPSKAPQGILGTGSGEEILPSPGTMSQTGLKPSPAALTAPKLPTGIPPQALQQSAEIVEEDDKTAISYIPMSGGKITVTLDSIEEAGSSKSPAPLSFPPKQLRPTDAKEVLAQMKKSFRPHIDPAIGDLTHPNDYITQVTPPGLKKQPSVSNAVNDKMKSIPYPTHLARNPEKFPQFSSLLPKPHTNSFSTPQFLVPQTQFSPQLEGYPLRNPSARGSYFHHKHPVKSVDSILGFSNLPDNLNPTQRPIPAIRQPPPMPAHLSPNGNNKGEDKPPKKRTKTRKRRPKPSTSTPLPPSMIEVVTHGDSGLNVHLRPSKDSGELTTLPTIITTPSGKRVWYGTTPQPPRYETQFPIKFNYITRSPTGHVSTTTTRAPTTLFATITSSTGKRVYHNLVAPGTFEHRLPQRLDVTNAPLYKKNMFPPRVMATNVPHEMTAYAKYTTTPIPPSPPLMRTVNLSTTTAGAASPTTTTNVSSQPVTSSASGSTVSPTTASPFTFPTTTFTPTFVADAVTESPVAVYHPTTTTTTTAPITTTDAPATTRVTTRASAPAITSTARPPTEPPTTPDEIFDFFTFPTTAVQSEHTAPTTSPAPVFLPQSDISLNHDRHDEIIVIDTEKERENMTASASTASISTLKPVLKVFSNRAGGTSWYKFKAIMTSTTPRPPLKMLNAVPVHDGYEKGFPFEFFTDLSLLSKTTGRPNAGATDFPQPVYKPQSSDEQDQNGIRRRKAK